MGKSLKLVTIFVLVGGLVLPLWGPIASAQSCWKFLSRQALIERAQVLAQAVTDLVYASIPRRVPPGKTEADESGGPPWSS